MTFDEFVASTSDSAPPESLSGVLKALWFAEKGDWEASHDIAQDIHSPDGSWMHAYLHRAEGDLGNASYWYNRANQPVASGSLDEERHDLIRTFLA